jgi:hypothetical protein
MTLLNHIQALEGFAMLSNEKLPISISFQIASNISKLKEITEPFMEFRAKEVEKLNNEYTSKGEKVPEEASAEFRKSVQSLLDDEIESDIKVVDLSSCDIEIAPQVLSMCMPFIKLDMDADKAV